MPSIDTLVDDIYRLLEDGYESSRELQLEAGEGTCTHSMVANQLVRRPPRSKEGLTELYASEYGKQCGRQLWYKYNKPEVAEKLPPYAKLKFMYGDQIEMLLLNLAREAGHTVEREQEVVEYGRVRGRIDAIIDGHLVDVKSMSTYSFKKYKEEGITKENDTFGYRWQLAAYHHGLGMETPSYILGMDKTLGHLALIPVEIADERSTELATMMAYETVMSDKLPMRPEAAEPVKDGKNRKLSIMCSYCDFKKECWPELRTFLYANGPRHLVEVNFVPKVPEAT